LHFQNNQLYCYPEHNDFDPEHGDVYPANTPFWVLSQGSSGSDQPFLRAIALTLASFRPDVRQRLIETGQLMPVVQILLRRSQKSVTTDEQYFTGTAHPVVFQSSELDPLRMITLAHELTPETLPAVTRIRVVREDEGIPGRDYFHPDAAERLFDTQSVIARVYRTTAARRRMVLDVSGSADPNGRPLTFRWAVLQGDAEAIRFEPLNASGSRVSVSIPWHPRTAVPGRPELQTSRVDLGVFALNGETLPLPAMICSCSLANEERDYFPDGRIRSVVYRTAKEGAPYVDPTIDIAKSWRDDYHYDDRNRLTGWTRTQSTGNAQEFAPDGRLITRRNDSGDPVEYRSVRYDIDTASDQVRTLREVILPAR
jgi:hypothetical protein